MTTEDSLLPEDLRRGLTTDLLGWVVHYYPECSSTNDLARALSDQGAGEGALVVADYQTGGHGRLGRTWYAPAGSSLLFSLLLRPHIPMERVSQVTMAAGLGCAAGLARAAGVNARLKWPNDITIEGRKAGGMLSEFGLEEDALNYVIVGVGVNIDFDPKDVDGIPPEATSLLMHTGKRHPRGPILRAILEEMEPRYRFLCGGGSLHEEWSRALETIGQAVRVTTHTEVVEGRAEGVEEDGALILRLADGTPQRVVAGDVITIRST